MMSSRENKKDSVTKNQNSQRDELMTELLRHTKPRKSAPEEVKQRIKHQVKVRWHTNNEKRKQKSWIIFGSLASAMGVMFVAFKGLLFQSPALLTNVVLERIQGEVITSIGYDDSKILTPGTMVETLADGYATLTLQTGGNLRLNHDTQLIVNESNEFTLAFGSIYFESDIDSRNKHPITIHTLYGDIQDIGTQFQVSADNQQIQVSVREGSIKLITDTESHQLPQGKQLIRLAGGNSIKSEISARDKQWQWVNEAAPKFTLEGKNLRQFLLWLTREHGLTLKFADTHIEQLAQLTILHGDINGLDLQQTLFTVFSTTEYRYTLEQDQLKVYRQ